MASLDGGAGVSLGCGVTTFLAFGLGVEVDGTKAAVARLDTVERSLFDAIATEGRLAESELDFRDGTRFNAQPRTQT